MVKRTTLVLIIVLLSLSGCKTSSEFEDSTQETANSLKTTESTEANDQDKEFLTECEQIASYYQDTYLSAAADGTLGQIDTMKKMVSEVGTNGYAVVDDMNQVNMVNADKVLDFIQKNDAGQTASVTLISIADSGCYTRYDFQASGGSVDVVRSFISWEEGKITLSAKEEYPAYTWKYTQEGYLLFERYRMPGYDGSSGHTAVRVQALDDKLRDLNRKYILPVSYPLNNLFIIDWTEKDFGDLNFYDLFYVLYPRTYQKNNPYVPGENAGVGVKYKVPKEEFEKVIQSCLNISSTKLESILKYDKSSQSYEYRPRGLYDSEPPSYPYPEVVGAKENGDGTITLDVSAVYPDLNLSKAYTHQVVIRPLKDGGFQYVSNKITYLSSENIINWHVNRLTDELWDKYYSGNF